MRCPNSRCRDKYLCGVGHGYAIVNLSKERFHAQAGHCHLVRGRNRIV